MLFQKKENLLSLYNALNGTDYTFVEPLEITTLENAVYMNYKNDISFVFDFELFLYEHQSTLNPNMPLRDLLYVSRVLQNRIRDKNLYSRSLVRIPAPRFVVFYNGTDFQPEQHILYLSDTFDFPKDVEKAVAHCIQNGILTDFLSQNRAEVIAVSIFEYDEEKHIKSEREEWREIGREEGMKTGLDNLAELLKSLSDAGKTEEMQRILSDSTYRDQLYREFFPDKE